MAESRILPPETSPWESIRCTQLVGGQDHALGSRGTEGCPAQAGWGGILKDCTGDIAEGPCCELVSKPCASHFQEHRSQGGSGGLCGL